MWNLILLILFIGITGVILFNTFHKENIGSRLYIISVSILIALSMIILTLITDEPYKKKIKNHISSSIERLNNLPEHQIGFNRTLSGTGDIILTSKNHETKKPLTIITAYYDLGKKSKKGKNGSQKYLSWIPNLLSYSGPMIIFVDSKTIDYVKTLRNGLPTIIVPSEVEDLMCNKYSGKFQLHKGPWYKNLDNQGPSVNENLLAIIWNEKLNFLKRGIELSTFDTPYYAWYDIGYIRNGNKIPSSWPSESKLRMGGEKVNLLTFSPKSDWCQFPYHRNEKLSYEEPPHGVMLTGGFILGTPETLKKFYTLFYNTLDEMVVQKEYTGNEQFTFAKCYCKNPDLFNLIQAVPHEFVDNDKWFYGVPHYFVQSPEKEKAMEVLENMDINELLTIGIKTFYRPHCLNNCIKVIRSFYPNIFIIVTDDSSDEVKLQNQDVIRKFKKIKYISLPYDTGLSKGRNIMVRHCPTKYFMITDDDLYLSEAFILEKAIAALEFHNADLIGGKLVSDTGNDGTWSRNFVDIKSKESDNLVGEKFIVKYNENMNYLKNPYLKKTFKTHTVLNHLIANTESLRASPWRDELKVGEHEIFFVDWYNNGFTVHELSGDDRKYLPGAEKFRLRTLPGNEFHDKQWVEFVWTNDESPAHSTLQKNNIDPPIIDMDIIFINLDSRVDRKELVEKEFSNLPHVRLKRFSAIKIPNKGGLGCSLSHISILKEAIKRKLPYICIIEDDFEFNIPREKAMNNIYRAIDYLGDDWDVLLLSAYSLHKNKINHPFLSKVHSSQTTGGYIVNSRYYQTLLDNFIEGAVKLEKDYSKIGKFAIDQYWKKLQSKDEWFVIEPLIARQRESFSDIENSIVNYES